MRGRPRAAAAAALGSLVLVASGCSGGDTAPDPDPTPSGGVTAAPIEGGAITIYGCAPKAGLVPGLTSETCGGDILDFVSAKLVHYDSETAAPENDIAQSIESSDNQTFTVKIKPGYTFSDGTEVRSKNFIDAWNFAANCVNGQISNYFFAPFVGYDTINTTDCKGVDKESTLTGLEVVDDHTFTIKTTEKVSNLPVRLGYIAFAPLPDSFFTEAGAKAQEKMPVTAGPFTVAANTTSEVKLVRNPKYAGAYKPHIDEVTVRIYQDGSAAYADLLGDQLDYLQQVPGDRLIGGAYKDELQGRVVDQDVGGNTWLTFSPTDPQLRGKPELNKAISMAIDRDLIIDKVFSNGVVKADGWVPPSIDGYKPGQCGQACTFNPAKAKQAFKEAGGYQGTLTITYNEDGPNNKAWTEAAANSIKNTLGIECIATGVATSEILLGKLEAGEVQGLFRDGWQMDYPSIENFLAPIYGTGAGSNYARYTSKAFDGLLTQAAAAPSVDDANVLYQKAEATLAADFPTAPLWNRSYQAGYSAHVTDVHMNAFGVLDLTTIRRTS
jgi:oligopeptide transport system substrate-binding protein